MSGTRCDILVVGAGPAGLIAAREAARANPALDILVLERDHAIGTPVRCGEGVGVAGLAQFLVPEETAPWISRRISRVILVAPDGTEVHLENGDAGYILDRSRFEPVLADQATAAGASFLLDTEATGMRRNGDHWAVDVRGPQREETIDARIVIGADGVEGMVGRWAGLDTRVPAKDMESCAQYVVEGIDFDPDAIYLHFGANVAPHGYAWVFPKGVGVANVGLGIVALHGKGRTARAWLDRYLDRHYASGVRTAFTVGGVIVHPTIKETVADGVLLCGDAAHMINPLSGGGIVNAMKAGRLAARTAVDALAAGDTSAQRLARYHRDWMQMLGEDHLRFYRVKEALNRFDDAVFNRLARTANGLPPEKRTLGRIFAYALVKQPALIPVLARYFA